MIANPYVGQVVWVEDEWDGLSKGIIVSETIVDELNKYKQYEVKTEDYIINVSKYCLYERYSEIILEKLERANFELNSAKRTVYFLNCELDKAIKEESEANDTF